MIFDGERTGKKIGAEQAVEQIRQQKLLHVSEYVKASQIKSLFSRFGSVVYIFCGILPQKYLEVFPRT